MKTRLLIFALSCFMTAPSFADKPSWAGKGNGKGHEARDDDRDGGRGGKRSKHFKEQDREFVRAYYSERYEGRGKCPPGLAKKHNGCMPPGQAKKWRMGRALPREVVYYPVPHELEVRIGLPPAGYKYVRVASDILMIAVGTGIVADAIEDLGRI